jgi:hypothetical protein
MKDYYEAFISVQPSRMKNQMYSTGEQVAKVAKPPQAVTQEGFGGFATSILVEHPDYEKPRGSLAERLAGVAFTEIIPTQCPVCGAAVDSVEYGEFVFYGCAVADMEHFIAKWAKGGAPKTVIPEPLENFNKVEKVFQCNCPKLLTFKSRRAHCTRCGTYQRVFHRKRIYCG